MLSGEGISILHCSFTLTIYHYGSATWLESGNIYQRCKDEMKLRSVVVW